MTHSSDGLENMDSMRAKRYLKLSRRLGCEEVG